MNVAVFHNAFESMRLENRGRQFDRRELGLLAIQYGIYFNSTMWASGLGQLFNIGKVGSKYIYNFKNCSTTMQEVQELSDRIIAYKHDQDRLINHARSILRRFNVEEAD